MHKTNLVLDLTLLTVILLVMSPPLTGIAWHEWLAIGLGTAVFVHFLFHWEWITRVGASSFKNFSTAHG